MPGNIIKLIVALLLFMNAAYSQAPSIEWQKCYGGTGNQNANSIQKTSDGGYIMCGSTNDGSSTTDFLIIKIDATGNMLWTKTYGGFNDERAYAIQQTTDAGFIVTGTTNSNNGDVSNNHGDYDWVLKLNNTGDMLWQKTFGGTLSDDAWDIHQTADGGYIVAAETRS